ncbi:MAG TPA: O-antigen ligase family protein [Candidatus Acidoferrales bacterium]|nr:O-antigen ligase family protein [Candidatus Acidoferrales bacterium]
MVLLLASAVALFPVRRSKLMGLVMLTIASLALSTALSPHPALSFYGTRWRQYGALTQSAVVIFAWALYTQTHRAGMILRAVSAAGALTAVYGIAQYLGWDPILPAARYHVGEGIWTIVRPPSTLGYVSYFATWLLFVVFLSLALPGRLAKTCTAIALIAMLLTGTRAAYLGLAAGAGVWLFWRGLRLPRRALWRAAIFAGAALLAAFVFYISPAGQLLRSRTRWFAEDPWGGARPLLWRDSLRMGFARPLAGHGPETFTAAFPHYESVALARAYPDFAHESPHNIFLDAFVAQGIAGFFLLAAWCALGFAAAWEIRGQHPDLAAGLAAALAAGTVSQQFTVFTIPTAVIFFATIAMAIGLAAGTVNECPAEPVRRFPFALPLLYFAFRIALADHALALAQLDLAAGNLTAAARHYESAGHTSDLWYSRALLATAGKAPTVAVRFPAFQLAAAAGERATRTAEDPFNAWYSLSTIRAGQNDATGTERCLRAAIAAHPTWFKPHWTLAQVLGFESRGDEAEREAALAADLDGGKHPEVAETLQELRLRQQK